MKNRTVKRVCSSLMAAVMAAVIAGCGSSSSAESGGGTEKTADGLDKVTFVSPTALESYDYLAIYAADYLGYFEEEGIDVELVEQIGADDVRMIASGTAQFGYPSPGVFMSSIDAGIDNVVGICNYDSIQIFGIAVNKDSEIKSFEDLKGKDVALYNESWTSLLAPLLDKSGLAMDDINMVSYGDGRYEAVSSGKAAGLGTWLSEYHQLVGQGYKFRYLDGNSICPQVSNSLCTNKELLEKDPDLVKRFVRAFTKGMYFCYCNPEAAADITLLTCPNLEIDWEGARGASEGDVMQIFGTTKEDQKKMVEKGIGLFEMEYCQNAADNLKASGAIKNDLDASKYYTNDYIDTGWDKASVEEDAANYKCSSEAYAEAQGQ